MKSGESRLSSVSMLQCAKSTVDKFSGCARKNRRDGDQKVEEELTGGDGSELKTTAAQSDSGERFSAK